VEEDDASHHAQRIAGEHDRHNVHSKGDVVPERATGQRGYNEEENQ
jgi:hypothetical protein